MANFRNRLHSGLIGREKTACLFLELYDLKTLGFCFDISHQRRSWYPIGMWCRELYVLTMSLSHLVQSRCFMDRILGISMQRARVGMGVLSIRSFHCSGKTIARTVLFILMRYMPTSSIHNQNFNVI